jgi:hypothetical protein
MFRNLGISSRGCGIRPSKELGGFERRKQIDASQASPLGLWSIEAGGNIYFPGLIDKEGRVLLVDTRVDGKGREKRS